MAGGWQGSRVFLCSTATAAASAIEGKITDRGNTLVFWTLMNADYQDIFDLSG